MSQDGSSGLNAFGFSLQLGQKVTESISKVLEEKFSKFTSALEVMTNWFKGNNKILDMSVHGGATTENKPWEDAKKF